jgi:hypothetical protein
MRAIELDERKKPVVGEILGVWPQSQASARAITRRFGRLARTAEPNSGPYCLFEACPDEASQPQNSATGDLIARVMTVIQDNRAKRGR